MSNTSHKHSHKKQYSKKYFSKQFPPNHNPLIGLLADDTFNNIYDVLALLQELTITKPNEGLFLSDASTGGVYYLLENAKNALKFEVHHRKKKKSVCE